MTRGRVPALAVAALTAVALMAAGCGGGADEDAFAERYKPLNERLLALGRDLDAGLRNAQGKSNKALSEQFAAFALRLEAINRDIRALDPPGELEDETTALTSRIDATAENLNEISGAAANNDPQAAAAATVDLAATSQELNRAQNRLARATGARVGPR